VSARTPRCAYQPTVRRGQEALTLGRDVASLRPRRADQLTDLEQMAVRVAHVAANLAAAIDRRVREFGARALHVS
jgi:hypothetical protein